MCIKAAAKKKTLYNRVGYVHRWHKVLLLTCTEPAALTQRLRSGYIHRLRSYVCNPAVYWQLVMCG